MILFSCVARTQDFTVKQSLLFQEFKGHILKNKMADDDRYEEYETDDKAYAQSGSRKGKSKKEAHLDSKSQSGSGMKPGQERKLAENISNAEQKRKDNKK